MEKQFLRTPQLHEASGDYCAKLLESIDGASDRILLETMVFDSVGRSGEVMESCLAARKRGVAVMMVYDRYAHIRNLSIGGPRAHQKFKSEVSSLKEVGVTLLEVGKRGVNPFAGRHHVKTVVVDDHAYVGGGINMTGDSFETIDYMLRYDDEPIAQALYDTLPDIAVTREYDQTIYADSTNEIMVDAGRKNQSLIYERTCQLATDAVKAYYVSKLAPDGELLRILKDKDAQYWFNTSASATGFDKLAIAIDRTKSPQHNNYAGGETLHAKFCVFEMSDGSKEAITGSHNFNSRGVAFGTQEIAIHTKDRLLCDRLLDFASGL